MRRVTLRARTVALVALALGCASSGGMSRVRTDAGPIDAPIPPGTDAGPPGIDAPIPPGTDAGPPECTTGASEACTSSCGSMGLRICAAEHWSPCAAPAEDCNGRDDDCDGRTDETIAPRACSSGCGGGTESCSGGTWSGCTATMPTAETCNSADDDCDSRVDEALSRPCSTACGMGTETCMVGAYRGCTAPMPRTETCNNADEDCDGAIDDGVSRPCANACGTAGAEVCSAGSYGACTAPPTPTETCNRADDDCDGVVDDGFRVTVFDAPWTELRAAQPACASATSSNDVCLTAAKRWCVGHPFGCFSGGVGLLGSTLGTAHVACFGSPAVEVATTFAEVSSRAGFTVDASNVGTRVAASAANRYCRVGGYEAGVGPIEHSDPSFYLTCLPSSIATYTDIATSELVARGCDPITNPNRVECAAAADAICRARGEEAGWGPVEWNTTDSAIVCLGD